LEIIVFGMHSVIIMSSGLEN